MDNSLKDDFLKELANIGLGNAATSLSKMVNSRVDISLPTLGMIPVGEIVDSQQGNFCVVMTGISGDAKGTLISLFSQQSGLWLVDMMFGREPGTSKEFDEDGKAAIGEFANIIGGSFLSSLSNFSSMNFLPKIPVTLVEEASKIKEDFHKLVYMEVDEALYVKTEISVAGEKIEGDVYLILDNESFNSLFKKFQ